MQEALREPMPTSVSHGNAGEQLYREWAKKAPASANFPSTTDNPQSAPNAMRMRPPDPAREELFDTLRHNPKLSHNPDLADRATVNRQKQGDIRPYCNGSPEAMRAQAGMSPPPVEDPDSPPANNGRKTSELQPFSDGSPLSLALSSVPPPGMVRPGIQAEGKPVVNHGRRKTEVTGGSCSSPRTDAESFFGLKQSDVTNSRTWQASAPSMRYTFCDTDAPLVRCRAPLSLETRAGDLRAPPGWDTDDARPTR